MAETGRSSALSKAFESASDCNGEPRLAAGRLLHTSVPCSREGYAERVMQYSRYACANCQNSRSEAYVCMCGAR